MANRRLQYSIGGFLILVFLSLIAWNLALNYNFPVINLTGILIGVFGFYMLAIVLTSRE